MNNIIPVDCSERKRPPQWDTNKAFRLPSRAYAPAMRKRTPTVFLFASTQMFCGPVWLGQKATSTLRAGDKPMPV
ncbi:hypothetical protein AM501_08230 [Aneurinibacillus migulanus]|nr:hypothetical protein TS64_05195 [Aneurinibacillus migulanus]KPD08757.1 hypothetical protein AM501_08230 [Aneurinibacillus migulanus]